MSALASPVSPPRLDDSRDAAKEYGTTKNRLFLARRVLTLVIVVVYLLSGLSQQLADGLRATFSMPWLVTGFYLAITVFGFAVLMFPLSLYEEYSIEEAFGRSDRTLGEWFHSYLLALLLELGIVVGFFEVLYALLRRFPATWWIWTAMFYISAVMVFFTLGPVLVLPLIFKAKPILDASWLPRVRRLLNENGLADINLFEWGFHDRGHTENVELVGFGKMRRILIADTVLANYTDDEITALIAHELGHYRHGDLWHDTALGGFTEMAGYYVAHHILIRLAPVFGFASPADIAAFPILVFSLLVLSLISMPAFNTVSRHREYAADAYAIRLMGTADPLISALMKATEHNLADPRPPVILEVLLHSHPSLERRIEHARRVEQMLSKGPPTAA